MEIILTYTQASITYSETFEALSLKGIDEPDRLRLNAVTHEYLNGNLEQQINGFFKEPIEISFKPTLTVRQRRFLVSWYLASVKLFVYGAYISQGTTDETLLSEWLYECELNREFTIQFWDEHKYYEFEDGIISEADLYIKLAVEIDPDTTQDSPETFVTNSGKLATMQNMSAWPSFNSTTHDFLITVITSDASGTHLPTSLVSVSSGNITFTTFPAGNYILTPGGKLYANISIAAVAK